MVIAAAPPQTVSVGIFVQFARAIIIYSATRANNSPAKSLSPELCAIKFHPAHGTVASVLTASLGFTASTSNVGTDIDA